MAKRGRPKLPSDRVHSKIISVRLREETLKRLRRRAKADGQRLAVWLRNKLKCL